MTPAQLAALKADILASQDMVGIPMTNAGASQIAALYNTVGAVNVWNPQTAVRDVYNAIDWSKFTPIDAPDATVTYTNRLLAIQTKQMNLTNMLPRDGTFDARLATLRAGLRDAVIALPAGAGGASVTAGGASGATVLAACVRKALRIEALFAPNSAITGTVTAYLLTYIGTVSSDDVQAARELP